MVPAGDPTQRDRRRRSSDLLAEGDVVVDGGNSRWTDDKAQRRAARREGHRLRRLRRLRRRLGPGERLRADGRRRRRRHRRPCSRSSTPSSPRASSAGCTPARSAPGTSPRWSTTASSTPSCRPTPRAGSCSEAVDEVDNVTEVFRSWREGTVIRSWLLDLLVAALDDDDEPRPDRAATPRTPARAAGPSRPASTTPSPTPAITAALFARFVSRQDDSPAMKAVAAMRNQFGGHADAAPAPRPTTAATTAPPDAGEPDPTVHVSHLSLHDFRSYPEAEVALGPGVTAFVGRNGQGKTNLVEAVDYIARLASHRVAGDAPLVRLGADQAVVRAAVVRDGREARARGRDQPGQVQPGPGQPVPAAPGPRAARPGAHGAVLARGPRPGQGRPVRAAPLPRRPAGAAGARGTPACAPTTTGCSSSATRCSRRAGIARRQGRSGESALSTLDVWDSHLARTGAELLAARLDAGRRPAAATSRAAYEAVAAGRRPAPTRR